MDFKGKIPPPFPPWAKLRLFKTKAPKTGIDWPASEEETADPIKSN